MCITPMWRREYQVNVPCGRCPVCVKRKISQWSVRLLKEGDVSTSALFITLTYSTTHVPITPNGWLTLDKKHLQDFFKRLRYYDNKQKIKYYAVGEYGTKFHRPHYHAIIYNSNAEAICKAWNYGSVHIGQLTPASCGYTLKYVSKKKQTKKPNDDRSPIFSIMSKGLGKAYVEDERNINFHLKKMEERYFIPAGNGVKASMPRYYRQRIYNSEQFGKLKGVLEKIANEKTDELHKKYSTWHIAQLHVNQFNKMHKNERETDSGLF